MFTDAFLESGFWHWGLLASNSTIQHRQRFSLTRQIHPYTFHPPLSPHSCTPAASARVLISLAWNASMHSRERRKCGRNGACTRPCAAYFPTCTSNAPDPRQKEPTAFSRADKIVIGYHTISIIVAVAFSRYRRLVCFTKRAARSTLLHTYPPLLFISQFTVDRGGKKSAPVNGTFPFRHARRGSTATRRPVSILIDLTDRNFASGRRKIPFGGLIDRSIERASPNGSIDRWKTSAPPRRLSISIDGPCQPPSSSRAIIIIRIITLVRAAESFVTRQRSCLSHATAVLIDFLYAPSIESKLLIGKNGLCHLASRDERWRGRGAMLPIRRTAIYKRRPG